MAAIHNHPVRFDNKHRGTEHSAMNVNLPTALEEFVRRKVAAGEFESADEVVREALRLLQQQEEQKDEVRRKIDLGWEQAKSGRLGAPEQSRENLAARKEAWKPPSSE